jgi:hypothetical protein
MFTLKQNKFIAHVPVPCHTAVDIEVALHLDSAIGSRINPNAKFDVLLVPPGHVLKHDTVFPVVVIESSQVIAFALCIYSGIGKRFCIIVTTQP